MTVLARDVFDRAVSNGLGVSSSGQAWSDTPGGYTRVESGSGIFTLAANARNIALTLGIEAATSTDVTVELAFDALPDVGNAVARIRARIVGGSDYHARLTLTPSGAMRIGMYREETASFGGTVDLSGVYTPGLRIRVRMQAMGANPTTLRAKAWRAMDPEPSGWAITATDSDPALQGAGVVGLRAVLSSTVTTPYSTRLHLFQVSDGVGGGTTPPDPEDLTTVTFRLRRGIASHWAAKNPVLDEGEPGFETDTGKLKIGFGARRWLDLPYLAGEGGGIVSGNGSFHGMEFYPSVATMPANLEIGVLYVVDGVV